jgi:hypothetical protein
MKFAAPLFPALAGLLLALASCASAQEAAPEPGPIQAVRVSGVRDPAIMPYQDAYRLMREIRDGTRDRVEMQIRVTGAKSHQPVPGLEIALRGQSVDEKLAISPEGFVTVPLSQQAFDEHAEFVTNQKKGALMVEVFIVPRLAPQAIRYGDMVEAIKAAEVARVALVPWYLRLLVPKVKEVGLCYPAPAQGVAIQGPAGARRAADVEDSDTTGAKVWCASFSARERELVADSVIVPAEGWKPMFR